MKWEVWQGWLALWLLASASSGQQITPSLFLCKLYVQRTTNSAKNMEGERNNLTSYEGHLIISN